MMRLRVIACDVLRREVYWCAAQAAQTVDVTLLPQGLHSNSDTCRQRLQPLVAETDPERYDALVLGYGLCNNALAGVRAGAVPLVVPRAHDCITLLLGSKERYAKLFAERPGTYWYSSGWLECRDERVERVEPMASSGLSPDRHAAFEELVAKYGRDNADYLADVMGAWEQNYTHGALIEFDFDRSLGLEEEVRTICREKGWEFVRVKGDLGLVQDGMDGRWDEERFLTVRPGQRVRADYDTGIISAEPVPAEAAESE